MTKATIISITEIISIMLISLSHCNEIGFPILIDGLESFVSVVEAHGEILSFPGSSFPWPDVDYGSSAMLEFNSKTIYVHVKSPIPTSETAPAH